MSSDAPSHANPSSPSVDLSSLIARVEAATGPDRELEWSIWALVQGVSVNSTGEFRGPLRWPHYEPTPVTTSLDAALALVERVLPGCRMDLSLWSIRPAHVGLRRPGDRFAGVHAFAPNPALALTLALLRALQAQPDRHNAHDGASHKNPSQGGEGHE